MKKETIVIDNRTLYKTYHDKYEIKKVGTNEIFTEAIDIQPTEYELTNIEIPKYDDEKHFKKD